MSKSVSVLDAKLPAHLQVLASDGGADEWMSGTASGFPVISIKGKVFHIKRGDEEELVIKPGTEDDPEPASRLQMVVLRSNKGVARTYYEDAYVEGSDEAPTCYSNDGVRPEPDAEDRQSKSCATCPHAQWGSRMTENGKKGKACSEVKRLAVAPAGQLNDPMLLRIPPTSLKTWDRYVSVLLKRGLNPTQVITSVSFDPAFSHQVLVFKPTGFVTDEMLPDLQAVLQEPVLETIIGAGPVPALPDSEDDDSEDDEAPAPKKKPAAKKKPVPVEEPDDDDSDEDEAPAPAPKRKPAAKKKPAPVVEDEDDDSDEDEAPAPKKKPAAKKKPAPVEEPDDDDSDDGLDGLDDLDFDDLNLD